MIHCGESDPFDTYSQQDVCITDQSVVSQLSFLQAVQQELSSLLFPKLETHL